MNCPRCGTTTGVKRVKDLEVPSCDRCGGMFLDHGELNRAAERTSGDLEFATLDVESFQHDDEFGPTTCPRCQDVTMGKVEFNIYTNIILDYCTRCHGFWLDGRELNRINDEVRKLNDASAEVTDPPALWFARFIWSLPR